MSKKYFDALDNILDRPIAFNPSFKKITGSTNAALLLSQAFYWTKRTIDKEGWFYKTREEWVDETGLTLEELDGARTKCKAAGVMEEKLKGVPATVHYRVNKPRVYELLGFQFGEIPQSGLSGLLQIGGKPESGSYPDFNKESESTSEITSEEDEEANPLKKFDDPQFGQIVTDWNNLHTFLIPTHANLLGCMLDEWRDHAKLLPAGHPDKALDPVVIFKEAMVITGKNARNPHSLSYMDRVIKNWIHLGYGHGPNGAKPKKSNGQPPASSDGWLERKESELANGRT